MIPDWAGTWLRAYADPFVLEWLRTAVRWTHVIAAIAWIGGSFYFIALDLALRPPKQAAEAAEGVGGESWEIHGGGFYRVQKYTVAPPTLPEVLHWYKWEAYTTWLSGAALLVLLYFVNADTYLIDRGVADIPVGVAIAGAIAVLGLGWLVYDGLCRVLEDNDRLLAAIVAGLVVLEAWGLSQFYSGRAVYILTGATLATIMSANVFFIIIPGQKDMVRAMNEGRPPNPIHGIRGKQRSIHNNYFTLPVLFAMISNHVPVSFGHPQSWLILVALMALGAWIRHFFNLRHEGRVEWAIPITAVVAFLIIIGLTAPVAAPPRNDGATVAAAPPRFDEVQAIITVRCVACHSATPANTSFPTPPKGITFDTPEQIRQRASQIEEQAVIAKTMPLGNLTGMTQQERDTLGAWLRAQRGQ